MGSYVVEDILLAKLESLPAKRLRLLVLRFSGTTDAIAETSDFVFS
jgi:hypothetical protein